MRKRNNKVTFRLNDTEYINLKKRVEKSGMFQETFIRHIINDLIPQSKPPPDYYAMMKELHHIGNNLNQIAQKAHVLNVIDAGRYDIAVKQFIDAINKIEEAVLLPKKRE